MVLEYQAAKEREFVDLDFSNFDQINRLLDVLRGNLWEGWSYQISFALRIGFSSILSLHMSKSVQWFGRIGP